MVRIGLKLLIVLALIWGGWWVLATSGLQRGIDIWSQARAQAGIEVSIGEVARSGFPLRIGAVMRDVTLRDTRSGGIARLPQMDLSAPVYWPGHARVILPAEPLTFTAPQAVLSLTHAGAQADLRLRPGAALQLEAMAGRLLSGALAVDGTEVLRSDRLDVDIRQGDVPERYSLTAGGTAVAPAAQLRDALGLPADWPQTLDTLVAQMTVTFDRPWDRTAIALSRPQPREIAVERVEAAWADLRLTLGADLSVAPGGQLSGDVRLQAAGWREMLDLASAGGALPPQMRQQAETVLQLLAGLSGDDRTLDVTVTLEQGQMRVGFIPLGPAPLLILR